MREEVDKKILSLMKLINPEDPLDYLLNNDMFKKYYYERINECIRSCNRCGICKNGIKSVVFGSYNAPILVINEYVTIEQYNQGNKIVVPMQGPTKDLFLAALKSINANADLMCFINAVNCCPTDTVKNEELWRAPQLNERENCLEYVNRIIDLVKPAVILTLGAVPYNLLYKIAFNTNTNMNIETNRGNAFYYKGYYTIPTINPEIILNKNGQYSLDNINNLKIGLKCDLIETFKAVSFIRPTVNLEGINLIL